MAMVGRQQSLSDPFQHSISQLGLTMMMLMKSKDGDPFDLMVDTCKWDQHGGDYLLPSVDLCQIHFNMVSAGNDDVDDIHRWGSPLI